MRTSYNGRNSRDGYKEPRVDKVDTGDVYTFDNNENKLLNDSNAESIPATDNFVDEFIQKTEMPENFADSVEKEEEEFPALEENPLNEMAKQAFIELANEAYNRYHAVEDQGDNYDNYDENYDEVPEKKKMPTWAKVAIILGSILLAVALVVGTLFLTGKIGKKNETPKVDVVSTDSIKSDVQSQIDKLYVDNLKSDIKDGYTVSDLDSIKDLVSKLDEKDSKNFLDELSTIELYLTDIKKVNTYADLSYNIEPDYVGEDLRQAQRNTESYTVAGLKATMTSKIKDITDDRDAYLGLKGELKLVKDPINYDETLYKGKISAIKHTVNKEDLQSMSDSLVAEKELAKAEKALKEAEDQKAKEEAQSALEAAQKKQKEMESQLEAAQKALSEAQSATQPNEDNKGSEEPTEVSSASE